MVTDVWTGHLAQTGQGKKRHSESMYSFYNPPPPGRCLSGGGRGGRGSRGGAPALPCWTEPYRPGIAKMHHIDPFNIYICHNV